MTPEEAYEEAQRRIREAEETEALELDLGGFDPTRLLAELKRLTSLRSLNFSCCLISASPRWQASPRLRGCT
jgi:hypothetical protein